METQIERTQTAERRAHTCQRAGRLRLIEIHVMLVGAGWLNTTQQLSKVNGGQPANCISLQYQTIGTTSRSLGSHIYNCNQLLSLKPLLQLKLHYLLLGLRRTIKYHQCLPRRQPHLSLFHDTKVGSSRVVQSVVCCHTAQQPTLLHGTYTLVVDLTHMSTPSSETGVL